MQYVVSVQSIVMVVDAMEHILNKEKCTTKAEFFIVLHNYDCREVTSPSRL